MPFRHRHLRSQNQRTRLATILADLPEVAPFVLTHRRHCPVVHHQHIDLAEAQQEIAQAAIGTRQRQVLEQGGGAQIEGRVTIAASLVRQSTSQVAFAHASRAADENILMLGHPARVRSTQLGPPQSRLHGFVLAALDAVSRFNPTDTECLKDLDDMGVTAEQIRRQAGQVGIVTANYSNSDSGIARGRAASGQTIGQMFIDQNYAAWAPKGNTIWIETGYFLALTPDHARAQALMVHELAHTLGFEHTEIGEKTTGQHHERLLYSKTMKLISTYAIYLCLFGITTSVAQNTEPVRKARVTIQIIDNFGDPHTMKSVVSFADSAGKDFSTDSTVTSPREYLMEVIR